MLWSLIKKEGFKKAFLALGRWGPGGAKGSLMELSGADLQCPSSPPHPQVVLNKNGIELARTCGRGYRCVSLVWASSILSTAHLMEPQPVLDGNTGDSDSEFGLIGGGSP